MCNKFVLYIAIGTFKDIGGNVIKELCYLGFSLYISGLLSLHFMLIYVLEIISRNCHEKLIFNV